MLRDYSPSVDDYIYIDSPIIYDTRSSSLELNLLLANASSDTPVGCFLKILIEDQSGTCPVCYTKLDDCSSPPRSRTNTNPVSYVPTTPSCAFYTPYTSFCSQSCYELAVCFCVMLDGSLRSRPHEMIVLNLRDSLAQKALNMMQKIADSSPIYQRPLRSLIIQLARLSERLPSSLFLQGVRLENGAGFPNFMSGGFADVYRGRYQRKDVALKVLRAFSNTNQVTQNILIRKLHYEALLWRNINHRHVLPFLGIDDCIFNSGACMVSAYMAHGYVRHKTEALLRQYGQDDLYYRRYIYKWLYETALGLDYLHEEGIVHGDLRGPNILIDETRSVLLADFGLSVFAESNSRQNGSSRGGNPRWMAPEQLDPEGCGKNSDRPTIHSDVFSFACVCVELYTSQIPYQELTDYQVLMGVPQGRRPAFKTRNTDFELDVGIPLEPLKRLANRCWSHAPEERPHIKEIVSHMAGLQIPWVSSPMSNTWPLFDSGC